MRTGNVRQGQARRRRLLSALRPRILVPFALALLAAGVAYPVLTGKTSPPTIALADASRSLEQARRGGAGLWAPDELAEAEEAFRIAFQAHRRQEVRFLLWRDFTGARELLRTTGERARHALMEADRRRASARATSEKTLGLAEQALREAESFARILPLDPSQRALLQRSRLSVAEARVRHREGQFVAAGELADRATLQAEEVRRRTAVAASRYDDPDRIRAWRRWIAETLDESRRTHGPALIVFKDRRRIELYHDGRPVASYAADLGSNAAEDKRVAGDRATPEGRYRVAAKKGAGQSAYYKALLLDYPNADDRRRFARAKREGRIPEGATLGGLIEIHGEGGRGTNWTRGCVAVSNAEMDDLFSRVRVSTPVTVVGGDGNGGAYRDLARRWAEAVPRSGEP